MWNKEDDCSHYLGIVGVDEALFEAVENKKRDKKLERRALVQLIYILAYYLHKILSIPELT